MTGWKFGMVVPMYCGTALMKKKRRKPDVNEVG